MGCVVIQIFGLFVLHAYLTFGHILPLIGSGYVWELSPVRISYILHTSNSSPFLQKLRLPCFYFSLLPLFPSLHFFISSALYAKAHLLFPLISLSFQIFLLYLSLIFIFLILRLNVYYYHMIWKSISYGIFWCISDI